MFGRKNLVKRVRELEECMQHLHEDDQQIANAINLTRSALIDLQNFVGLAKDAAALNIEQLHAKVDHVCRLLAVGEEDYLSAEQHADLVARFQELQARVVGTSTVQDIEAFLREHNA